MFCADIYTKTFIDPFGKIVWFIIIIKNDNNTVQMEVLKVEKTLSFYSLGEVI